MGDNFRSAFTVLGRFVRRPSLRGDGQMLQASIEQSPTYWKRELCAQQQQLRLPANASLSKNSFQMRPHG